LAALDETPRTKAELLERSRIAEEDWSQAIAQLCDTGKAVHIGHTKASRYARPGFLELKRQAKPHLPVVQAEIVKGARTRLLVALDETPRMKGELIRRARIEEHDWDDAISYLVEVGMAVRSGQAKGTRYALAGSCATMHKPFPSADPMVAARPAVEKPRVATAAFDAKALKDARSKPASAIASDYHDVVEEVLRELCGDEAPRTETEKPVCDAFLEPRFDVVRPTVPETPSPLVSSNPREPLDARLRSFGFSVIDHRDKAGCLWVLDGPTVAVELRKMAAADGVTFRFTSEGARATDYRPAWWTTSK